MQGGIGHREPIANTIQQKGAKVTVAMETFLDPPCNDVLVETEPVLVNKINGRDRREQERIFAFQPAVLYEEAEDKRSLVFARLFGNATGRHKRFCADLTATTMQRPVGVDAELLFLRIGKHHANMPVQKVLVRNQGRRRIDFAFRLNRKAADKIAEAGINRGPAHERTVEDKFAAHRKEERLELAVLAHRNRQSKFVKRKSSGTAVINQVQATALPHVHLGEQARNTLLVGIKGQGFGLDESIV